ncbi:MAG: tRNA (N(6)-L-threonylcarbamoyladenosine(37)-C(2))-methylthiotransferase MtaB [Lachnospiraceae bacterium]|nr:tRNA (N(6)-L-threonylcarbamoyladenosine(37)-C(2))-methylthiotransferase MtaB [Lachnospiraceae bacterium]
MKKNGKKAALHNLGCKVNAYETEAMQQLLEQAGYEIVPFEPGADVYVINTCSVTNIADRKSRQMLHRAKKLNPNAIVVAAGCYVQTAKERTGLAVEADIILGNNRKKDLAAVLQEYEAEQERQSAAAGAGPQESCPSEQIIDVNHTKEYESLFITRTEAHTRAYIKVQDGCNQFCSYCIIPYARGRARSRELSEVLREIRALTENGVREVVLTGIHLSSYGTDQDSSLTELIRQVHEIEGISRIRLGSLEPGIVTEEFAAAMSRLPKLCPHFHLSLQSGCDTVLKRMNRRYTAEEYLKRCGILRDYFDRPALTTDVIVGFPGETEEEFAQTVSFLEKAKLYETHIFKYSKRKGTRAAEMPGQVTEAVKAARSDVLLELNRKNKAAFEQEWIGRDCEILFEEKLSLKSGEYYVGYTKEYIRAVIPADGNCENQILSGTLQAEAQEGYLLFAPKRNLEKGLIN